MANFTAHTNYQSRLIPSEIAESLPAIYAQEDAGNEAIVHVKLFAICSDWTWYITEYDPLTGQAFGLTDGDCRELGYISVPELDEIRHPVIPIHAIERDLHWSPKPLSQC